MVIEKDKVVSVSYKLTVDKNVVDQSQEDDPLAFLFGVGQMIPGFEKNLAGLKQGDEYDFKVSPEEGYGQVNEQAIVDINKEVFVSNGELIKELVVDAVIPMQDQEGNRMNGRVISIGVDKVKLDFNHPLAGKELNFTGQVKEVREATPEELDHGHVHGPSGHQH